MNTCNICGRESEYRAPAYAFGYCSRIKTARYPGVTRNTTTYYLKSFALISASMCSGCMIKHKAKRTIIPAIVFAIITVILDIVAYIFKSKITDEAVLITVLIIAGVLTLSAVIYFFTQLVSYNKFKSRISKKNYDIDEMFFELAAYYQRKYNIDSNCILTTPFGPAPLNDLFLEAEPDSNVWLPVGGSGTSSYNLHLCLCAPDRFEETVDRIMQFHGSLGAGKVAIHNVDRVWQNCQDCTRTYFQKSPY